MPPLLQRRPTAELVAVSWIATIPGIGPDIVATQVPPDANKDGTPAAWVARGQGFVQVIAIGGNPDPLLPVHRTVFQVDTWAAKPGSNKPPWEIANVLAETIVFATWDRVTLSRRLDIRVKGEPYPPAVVQGARVLTDPRRTWGDTGAYAHYSMDLQLQWMSLRDVLA